MTQYLVNNLKESIGNFTLECREHEEWKMQQFKCAMFNLLKNPAKRTEKEMILSVSVGHKVKNGFLSYLSCTCYVPFLVVGSYNNAETFTIKDGYNTLFSLNLSRIKNLSVKAEKNNTENYPFTRYSINFNYHGGLDYDINLVVHEKKCCKQTQDSVK